MPGIGQSVLRPYFISFSLWSTSITLLSQLKNLRHRLVLWTVGCRGGWRISRWLAKTCSKNHWLGSFGKIRPWNQKTTAYNSEILEGDPYLQVGCSTWKTTCYWPGLLQGQCTEGSLVNDLEKKFNALKFPVLEDKYSAMMDAEEKEDVKSCAEFVSLLKTRIDQ